MSYAPRNCRPHAAPDFSRQMRRVQPCAFEMSTAQGQKSPSVRAVRLPVADDDVSPLGWRDHLSIGAAAIGITTLAILAARAIALYAPRLF